MRTEIKKELVGSRPEYLAERRWLCLLIPAVLAILIHLPALWADLFLDDGPLIVEHPRIAEAGFIKEVFGRDYGLELGVREKVGYYRPLLLVVNYGLYRVVGPSAPAYHTAILLTFCLSCVLLTAVTLQAVGEERRWLAMTIGCLAAVHPIRTEFAVFFGTMPDLLMEICCVLVIGISLGFFGKWPSPWRMILLGGVALAAGLTKESSYFVITAIGATLFLSGILSREDRARLGQGFVLFAGLGGALALRRWEGIGLPGGGVEPGIIFTSGSNRALDGLIEGLGNLLMPSKTVFESLREEPPTFGGPIAVVTVLGLAALLVIWLVWRGRLFEALIGAWLSAGFFSLMLLRARDIQFSDRYIPSGAAIVALCLAVDYIGRRWRIARWGVAPALLVAGYIGVNAVFGWISTMQCESALIFFTTMADDHPKSFYPRLILSNMMYSRYRNLELAVKYVQEAVAVAPGNVRVRALGLAIARRFIETGENQRGLETLAWSSKGLPESAELWSLRAKAEAGLRDFPAAIHSMQRAVALAPERIEFRQQLEEITAAAAK